MMMYEDKIIRGTTLQELHDAVNAAKEEGWETVNALYYAWDGKEAGFEWKVRRLVEEPWFTDGEWRDLRDVEDGYFFETPKPSAADPFSGTNLIVYVVGLIAGAALLGAGTYAAGLSPIASGVLGAIYGFCWTWWWIGDAY